MAPLPTLRIKDGVQLDGLAPGGCRILALCAAAPLTLGFPITITCGLEGHGPEDPHTHGNALDLRTKDHSPLEIMQMISFFTQQLGTELFTILFEVPEAERASLDPALLDYVYEKSDPGAQHLHLQVRIGKVFPATPRPA